MILISHRGNIDGKRPLENQPKRIDYAISLGYNVEVDIFYINNDIYLGHDKPQYKINIDWLLERKETLWIHCKNIGAIEFLINHQSSKKLNYFFHDVDSCTITSKGFVWAYPGKQPIKKSIAVLPELKNESTESCIGICSDYIESYL
tara:strand:+ start:2055 stop:2495 length:441 start_codon:yes stop_codon:yes gene_type:complete